MTLVREDQVEPVSYTHLDVYKRQIYNFRYYNLLPYNKEINIYEVDEIKKAVSYTHLYSLVKPYNTEELKELGFSSNEIISYKKITLYDEIVLNPDVSKIKE